MHHLTARLALFFVIIVDIDLDSSVVCLSVRSQPNRFVCDNNEDHGMCCWISREGHWYVNVWVDVVPSCMCVLLIAVFWQYCIGLCPWKAQQSVLSTLSSCCTMIYSPQAFWLLAKEHFGLREDRTFRSLFGVSPDVCSVAWEWCRRHKQAPPHGMKGIHLLWALHFLKSYNTEDVNSTWANTTRKTWRKWVWIVLRLIRKMKREVVCHRYRSHTLSTAFPMIGSHLSHSSCF